MENKTLLNIIVVIATLLLSMVTSSAEQVVYFNDVGNTEMTSVSGEQAGSCEIELTFVPSIGSSLDLEGRVLCEDTNDCNAYSIAVYIYIPPYGWWSKPYSAQPLTPIADDCIWSCDITTGGRDPWAVKIIAVLWPGDGNEPPIVLGDQCLPSELFQHPLAQVVRYRTINFAGYQWYVKRSCDFTTNDKVGPGPNYFSDGNEDVFVDSNDYLHLKIVQRNGKYYCSEVIALESFGYGTYIITLQNRVDLLDERIVFGFFTWQDCVPPHYREIDIEFTRWSNPLEPNCAQYVIMPDLPGHKYRFNINYASDINCVDDPNVTTHIITWTKEKISFRSYYGDFSLVPSEDCIIDSWIFADSADIPAAGLENPRLNFWLDNGNPPNNGQDAEIVIKNFQYIPDVRPEIDFADYEILAGKWFEKNCGNCNGADLNDDGDVNIPDLKILTEYWLQDVFKKP